MQRKSSKVIDCKAPSAVKVAKEVLLRGGFVVAPTDTIYGILADATNYEAVERLYSVRRPSRRTFIVLVPDIHWIRGLGLEINSRTLALLRYPRITLVLRKRTRLFKHLGISSLAVRRPREGFIYRLLKSLNRPLVAPSANREGKPPAINIHQAQKYFDDKVELYVDCGGIRGKPSALLSLTEEKPRIIRSGSYSFPCLERLIYNSLFRP